MSSDKLFVCPKCGKEALFVHKKTYENMIIVFCGNCRLNSSFEPSKDAIHDHHKAWEEFITNYNRTQKKTAITI